MGRLGVGLLWQPALADFLEAEPVAVDYLEVIPDTMWRDSGPGGSPRFTLTNEDRSRIESYRSRMPMLLHGIGLSIGSERPLDLEYVEQLAEWCEWLDVPWFSEHLSYSTAAFGDEMVNAGLTLPLPLDQETVDSVGPKVEQLRRRLARPVLLENNVYYFPAEGEDLGEAEVLNRLCRDWGSDLLLDLHNLYVNVRNGVLDADAYLDELSLDRVREVHVAGGMTIDGFYVDAHSGPPAEEVWRLLGQAAARCPSLGAVTFELLGSWVPSVGAGGLRMVLERARSVLADAAKPVAERAG